MRAAEQAIVGVSFGLQLRVENAQVEAVDGVLVVVLGRGDRRDQRQGHIGILAATADHIRQRMGQGDGIAVAIAGISVRPIFSKRNSSPPLSAT